MKKTSFVIAAAIACASASAAVAISGPAHAAAGVRLGCTADGATDFSMSARYEDRLGRKKFNASFEAAPRIGFTIGQRLAVTVGGRGVGLMILRGGPVGDVIGDLTFDTRLGTYPVNFPVVVRGTVATVGALRCSMI